MTTWWQGLLSLSLTKKKTIFYCNYLYALRVHQTSSLSSMRIQLANDVLADVFLVPLDGLNHALWIVAVDDLVVGVLLESRKVYNKGAVQTSAHLSFVPFVEVLQTGAQCCAATKTDEVAQEARLVGEPQAHTHDRLHVFQLLKPALGRAAPKAVEFPEVC